MVWCRQGELPDPKSRSLEKEVEDFVKNVNKLPRYTYMTFTSTQYIVPTYISIAHVHKHWTWGSF